MPCQGVSGANIGNWLNSNAKKKWIWPSLGFAALPRGGGESGKPDMRLRVNPAVFSHDWTLKDARRCDQQLAGWIAMEWLRQLGGFHHRFEGSRCLGCSRSGRETHQPKCGCPERNHRRASQSSLATGSNGARSLSVLARPQYRGFGHVMCCGAFGPRRSRA